VEGQPGWGCFVILSCICRYGQRSRAQDGQQCACNAADGAGSEKFESLRCDSQLAILSAAPQVEVMHVEYLHTRHMFQSPLHTMTDNLCSHDMYIEWQIITYGYPTRRMAKIQEIAFSLLRRAIAPTAKSRLDPTLTRTILYGPDNRGRASSIHIEEWCLHMHGLAHHAVTMAVWHVLSLKTENGGIPNAPTTPFT